MEMKGKTSMACRHAQFQSILVALAILALFSACTTTTSSIANSPTVISGYRLNVSRLFGYSSGNQIKGSFQLSVIGSSNISTVDYILDGQVMTTVNTAPFQLNFQTETYPFGMHTLSAIITTTDGRNVEVPDRQFEFATAQQEQQSVAGVIVPLGAVILLTVVLGLGVQFLFMRNKRHEFVPLGTARNYGLRGGAICPKCHRPTVLHPFAPHFGLRLKYDICENCGKWSMMTVLPASELRKAETEEGKSVESSQVAQKTEEEKLKEILNESKYTN
jgi:hypothetical protein